MKIEVLKGSIGLALYVDDKRVAGARHNGIMETILSAEIAEAPSEALSSQSLSLSEAREEIERLKGKLASVRKAVGGFAKATGGDLSAAVDLISIRCAASERRRDELLEALRPFAKFAADETVMTNYGKDITRSPDGALACGLNIPVNAFRAAQSALENGPARLADATSKSPDPDLSSLRKRAEVAVKPLEWVTHDPDCWYARCPVSSKEYYVIREDGRWWSTWDLHIPALETAEEGKSAAQSDFETRIRSALVSGSREEQADG